MVPVASIMTLAVRVFWKETGKIAGTVNQVVSREENNGVYVGQQRRGRARDCFTGAVVSRTWERLLKVVFTEMERPIGKNRYYLKVQTFQQILLYREQLIKKVCFDLDLIFPSKRFFDDIEFLFKPINRFFLIKNQSESLKIIHSYRWLCHRKNGKNQE